MIIDLIRNSHNGAQDDTCKLIKKFDPLINKYARMLRHEDAYNDLLLEFLELVRYMGISEPTNTGDAYLVSYINTSMKRKYYQKISSKNILPIVLFTDMSECQDYAISSLLQKQDDYHGLLMDELSHLLNAYEYDVIYKVFFLGYSISEIAKLKAVSRQNINQTKKRALNKIRIWLDKQ
jgi:DNA-directed RNA polymerase specialized sigma subunit, sigma24 homolog